MPRYCPLGTPSLLDGDFWENVARLKDFSWSILLSSNPNNTEFAEESSKTLRLLQENPLNVVSNKTEIAKENSYFAKDNSKFAEEASKVLRLLQERPLDIFFRIILPFIYFSVYLILCYAIVSCVKIKLTRNLVVNVVSLRTLLIVSLTSALVFFRIDSNLPYLLIMMVNIHVLIFIEIFLFKCGRLSPSIKGSNNLRNIPLRIAGVILAVLVFFFTPAIPHEHDECPDKFLRYMSEVFLWMMFFFIFFCIRCVELMVYYHQSDVFYIWKYSWVIPFCYYRYKSVGQVKKKEGFGWITDYYSIDSKVENPKLAIP